ncbi:sulfate transporter family-domain-containing protein [Jimgerdemannia flammicorona]|uniref:Sulfate transporter family-domain-containing protein n=1 Tax=Jimgerdemannia flammicorona TaxID=994334 RepID=A0A433QII9_9FUNG|nr:sulfate transporter family-domain-containing protein [Jimgerdemannia flammicorona]
MSAIYLDDQEPSWKEKAIKFKEELPTLTKEYFVSLFPIATWIFRYNLTWFVGDLIAGITIGTVVVPQSMGYAKIANLPVEYGLYSSFVGVLIYCFFATSKDITIGPVAVMSLFIGQYLATLPANFAYTKVEAATALAFFGGIISLVIGLFRLGFIVDFIPYPAIAGFMTGSGITIAISQLPKLFGIAGIDNRGPAYLVLGNFFAGLPHTQVDVAFGLIGLLWLYGVRISAKFLTKRYPAYERHIFFFNISRNAILVIITTLIAWALNIGQKTSPISILKTVPAGLHDVHVPVLDLELISYTASQLPVVVLLMIMEHVTIAKSFGRLNDYQIDPDQEIVAIGVTNIIGAFFSAYPATGSFSRTAIKAKSGVRTPIAGVYTAIVVILALYALTPAFYYIPDAGLAAIIIHAVLDLISGPRVWKQLWNVNPLEIVIFLVSVIVTFFTNVENGIYASVGISIFFLLLRIARPRSDVLGGIPLPKKHESDSQRYIYVPINHPSLGSTIEPPPPGIIIYRLEESLTYPNSGWVSDKILHYTREHTKRGKEISQSKGSRPWNDAGPAPGEKERDHDLPVLKALVLDFSGVNNIDSTGVQTLLDVQTTLDRYADREVPWHFANIISTSIRRTLIVGGFGSQKRGPTGEFLPLGSYDMEKKSVSTDSASHDDEEKAPESNTSENLPAAAGDSDISIVKDKYPYFHYDVDEAVRAANRT